jgi:tripartite-type tricarboxylate transporter receptor subunit TctC
VKQRIPNPCLDEFSLTNSQKEDMMSFVNTMGKKWLMVGALTTMCAVAAATSGLAASTADYPDKQIRVIVPYKPGGGSDVRARLVAEIVRENKILPQPMVITNIPGGGAAPGQREVLNARPDGYTILIHHGQVIIGNLLEILSWNYDSFAPVAQITENPLVICTHKGTGWKSLDELLAAAKKNPDTVTWSWGGMGGHGHFASEALFDTTGIKVRPVAHGGAAESTVALAGGQVDISIFGVVPLEYVKAGTFVPLAVTSDYRLPQLPEVPTLIESGVNLSVSLRYSFFAPLETPEPVLNVLRTALKKVCDTTEFKDKIEKMGAVVKYRPGQELLDQFNADMKVFSKVIDKIKVKKK